MAVCKGNLRFLHLYPALREPRRQFPGKRLIQRQGCRLLVKKQEGILVDKIQYPAPFG